MNALKVKIFGGLEKFQKGKIKDKQARSLLFYTKSNFIEVSIHISWKHQLLTYGALISLKDNYFELLSNQ